MLNLVYQKESHLNRKLRLMHFPKKFNNCTIIDGDVKISGDDIVNLNGLSMLKSIKGNFDILKSNSLTTLSGLDNLNSIGNLLVQGNFNLNNLSGIQNLTSISSNIQISYNDALTSLTGLENIKIIGNNLIINGNFELKDLDGLENLASVGGDFTINSNYNITSLKGLKNLTDIEGSFYILGCNSLLNLKGLENLKKINGSLIIEANELINSLTGIENIQPNTIKSKFRREKDLRINDNPKLSSCSISSLCDAIILHGATTEIFGNGIGCNSDIEIKTSCKKKN